MIHEPVTNRPERRGGPVGGSAVVVPLPAPMRRPTDGGDPRVPSGPHHDDGSFTVDCADCAHRATAVCDDCVVSFIVGRAPEDALVVDADEARAVRLLERAGLVPGVRHEAQASGL